MATKSVLFVVSALCLMEAMGADEENPDEQDKAQIPISKRGSVPSFMYFDDEVLWNPEKLCTIDTSNQSKQSIPRSQSFPEQQPSMIVNVFCNRGSGFTAEQLEKMPPFLGSPECRVTFVFGKPSGEDNLPEHQKGVPEVDATTTEDVIWDDETGTFIPANPTLVPYNTDPTVSNMPYFTISSELKPGSPDEEDNSFLEEYLNDPGHGFHSLADDENLIPTSILGECLNNPGHGFHSPADDENLIPTSDENLISTSINEQDSQPSLVPHTGPEDDFQFRGNSLSLEAPVLGLTGSTPPQVEHLVTGSLCKRPCSEHIDLPSIPRSSGIDLNSLPQGSSETRDDLDPDSVIPTFRRLRNDLLSNITTMNETLCSLVDDLFRQLTPKQLSKLGVYSSVSLLHLVVLTAHNPVLRIVPYLRNIGMGYLEGGDESVLHVSRALAFRGTICPAGTEDTYLKRCKELIRIVIKRTDKFWQFYNLGYMHQTQPPTPIIPTQFPEEDDAISQRVV
ncbi:MAG: hypothetical protein LBF65_00680 [Holosporales bacterium]|jgi:hypothetical protein|nr:hypothetical protein [Holosporales bacterium]